MLKRILPAALVLTLLFAGCGAPGPNAGARGQNGSINIVATNFPQYDFARRVAGARANVTLLPPPGADAHNYRPTAADISLALNADLFIYSGDELEPWAKKIAADIDTNGTKSAKIVNTSKNIDVVKLGDIDPERLNDGSPAPGSGKGETPVYDPHIWMDPVFAETMVENIADALCLADPRNKSYYAQNAEDYKKELEALDGDFKKLADRAAKKDVVFGGRFAFYYLTKRYGFSYKSLYAVCGADTEPSASRVDMFVDYIKTNGVSVIFTDEAGPLSATKTVCEKTGARTVALNSCEGISKSELDGGVSCLDLMRQNVSILERELI